MELGVISANTTPINNPSIYVVFLCKKVSQHFKINNRTVHQRKRDEKEINSLSKNISLGKVNCDRCFEFSKRDGMVDLIRKIIFQKFEAAAEKPLVDEENLV